LIPRDYLVGWPLIKALRQAAEKNAGFLDLAALTRCDRLTPAQLYGLKEEFPDMDPEQFGPWQPLLLLPEYVEPRLRTQLLGDGLPARGLNPNAQRLLFPPDHKPTWPGADAVQKDPNSALRLGEERGANGRALVWEVHPGESPPLIHRLLLKQHRPIEVPKGSSYRPRGS
jgi:hypothetical protein